MLDLNKPVQTRDGQAVRILATDVKIASGNDTDTIVGVVEREDGRQVLLSWQTNGSFLWQTHENDNDLINVPEPAQEIYRLLPANNPGYLLKSDAIEMADHSEALGVVKLTMRDGKLEDAEVVYART